jgi:bifunctional ADP-heptose synthase (sugar kinase/adenylyltransferase)
MKLLVIGDSCLDIFKYGEVNRLAPEAPVPIIVPEYETSNPGMASNVVRNLQALGNQVDIITNRTEIRKTRYVCSKYNQLLLRVDENDICEKIDRNLLNKLNYSDYEAIIISDYCKGFLNQDDIEFISKKHQLTFLDTKKILGYWAHEIKFIKINSLEFKNNIDIFNSDRKLLDKVIVTKGKYGCEYQGKIYPTESVSVKDLSGAGDTFLAGLVSEYVRSKDIESAIKFAQECTTIVVQKSCVSTV